MYTDVYPCILMNTVYTDIPMYAFVYLCIPMYTGIYRHYTGVYLCIPMYTRVYWCIPVSTGAELKLRCTGVY